jgi:hypothetical protein
MLTALLMPALMAATEARVVALSSVRGRYGGGGARVAGGGGVGGQTATRYVYIWHPATTKTQLSSNPFVKHDDDDDDDVDVDDDL